MLGRIVNDEFVCLTVTDTAGGRKLEQVGWVKGLNHMPHYEDYGPEQIEQIRRWGYVPTFKEVE